MKTLVTYASKYGGTEEIAQKITHVLEEHGFTVDLEPVNQVRSIENYQIVILGSGVYIGGWIRSAVKFIKRFSDELENKNFWIFSSGPTGNGDPVDLLDGWKFPPKIQPDLSKSAPNGTAVFHGVLIPEKLNFLHRWMIKNVETPTGDFRDWDMITAWAKEIAA